MRKSKYSEGQIIGFLKQAEAGMAVVEICRKGGFSDATFYKWRAQFGVNRPSLSGILCVRHSMSRRSMYAEQENDKSGAGRGGGYAVDTQGPS